MGTFEDELSDAEVAVLLLVGRLSLASLKLEHQVRDVGRAVGLYAEASPSQLAVAVQTELDTAELPPWVDPAFDKTALRDWLNTVKAVHARTELLLDAAQRGGGEPRIYEKEQHALVPIGPAVYEEHIDKTLAVSNQGQVLLAPLGMLTRSGATFHGYREIVGTLYANSTNDETNDATYPVKRE